MRNFVSCGAALMGLLLVSGHEAARACPPAAAASSAVSSPSANVVVQSSPDRPRGLLVGLRDRNRGSSATAVSISKVDTGRSARIGVRERMSTARDVRKAMRSASVQSSAVQSSTVQSSTVHSSTVWQQASPVTVLSVAPGGGASASASASSSAAVPAAVIAPQPVEVAPPERPLLPSGILPPAPRGVPAGGGAAASSSASSS